MQSYKEPFERTLEREICIISVAVIFMIGLFFLDFSVVITIFFFCLAFILDFIEIKKGAHFGVSTYLLETENEENYAQVIKKTIENKDSYIHKRVDSKLKNWPCYTEGISYIEHKVTEGEYNGYDFLLSALEGNNIRNPFLSFKIKWQNKVNGKLLVSFNRYLLNCLIRGMVETKIDKDFYVLSDKKPISNQKIKELLQELRKIRHEYKDLKFTVFFEDDVIVITLLEGKKFCEKDLNIFFDTFDLLEKRQHFSALFLEKKVQKFKIRWDLVFLSIPILILTIVFLFGIYAAVREDKKFAFSVFVIFPVILLVGLVPEIIKYKRETNNSDNT